MKMLFLINIFVKKKFHVLFKEFQRKTIDTLIIPKWKRPSDNCQSFL